MAVKLRKLRQRFGITARKVAVRTEVAWYWRWLGVLLLLACAAALAVWIYDAGRHLPGADRHDTKDELAQARAELEAEHTELERLRSIADAAGSRIAIERTAEQKLAEQVRTLEQENGRMREELAIFEKMLSTDWRTAPPLTIYRFKVEPDMLPGEYRYRLLLASAAGRDKDFQGHLELVVSLTVDGKSAIMTFPKQGEASAPSFRLVFKRFQRVEGTFRVDSKSKVDSVQVRIYEHGFGQPRATQSVTLG